MGVEKWNFTKSGSSTYRILNKGPLVPGFFVPKEKKQTQNKTTEPNLDVVITNTVENISCRLIDWQNNVYASALGVQADVWFTTCNHVPFSICLIFIWITIEKHVTPQFISYSLLFVDRRYGLYDKFYSIRYTRNFVLFVLLWLYYYSLLIDVIHLLISLSVAYWH